MQKTLFSVCPDTPFRPYQQRIHPAQHAAIKGNGCSGTCQNRPPRPVAPSAGDGLAAAPCAGRHGALRAILAKIEDEKSNHFANFPHNVSIQTQWFAKDRRNPAVRFGYDRCRPCPWKRMIGAAWRWRRLAMEKQQFVGLSLMET